MSDRLAIILPAAGESARFGGGRNKLLELLAGRTVLEWSAAAFLSRQDVSQLIIATRHADAIRSGLGAAANDPRVEIVSGGACRAQSVQAALSHVKKEIEWVAVHDAARPLVSKALIDSVLLAARQHGAAAPAMPVALTVKQATGPLPAKVEKTVPRSSLWAMQTPQIAKRAQLIEAFDACPIPMEQITDDMQVLELAGHPVWLVTGEERNLKITTAIDLDTAKLILAAR
ncbi:2-C-methyl-D-erythritol 4-phosphate cytidylyltransferase [soil metagenome]